MGPARDYLPVPARHTTEARTMKKLPIVFGLVALWNAAASEPTQAEPLELKVQAVLRASDLSKAGEAFRALFEVAGKAGLPRLKVDAHDTIAIQAAWREVLLPLLGEEPKQSVPLDRRKLEWFLGFLEGRGRLQIPTWWRNTFLEARFGQPGNIHFPSKNILSYGNTAVDRISAPLGTTLTKENGSFVLKVDKQSVKIPDARVGGFFRSVQALMTPKRCYYVFHNDFGWGYPITCIERKSGKVIWKADVWATWCHRSYGPHPQSQVAIVEQDSRIVVFGISGGAHVEAFRAEDGKNLFRFSTYH
jgi:hypothetical protein